MYIAQKQLENLRTATQPGKVVVLYGARRTGKTTLLHEFLKEEDGPTASQRRRHRRAGVSVQPVGGETHRLYW